MNRPPTSPMAPIPGHPEATGSGRPIPPSTTNTGLSDPALPPVSGTPAQNSAESFLWQDEDLFINAPGDQQPSGAFAQPFEISQAMPPLPSNAGQFSGNVFPATVPGGGTALAPSAPPKRKPARNKTLLKVLLIGAVSLIAVGFLAMVVFAAGGSPHAVRTPGTGASTASRPTAQATSVKPQPTARPTAVNTPTTAGGSWVPGQLPTGWTQAGLNTGDALFAMRTGMTFTDREMSLDYRDIGTRGNHGGTLTAAFFLLTPAAQQRYQQNDVRVANNTLFDMVSGTKLIQAVVNSQPSLVAFQTTGGQDFAWVKVSFQLWQSRIDPQTGQRQEGLELDTGTSQPRVHQMFVLLLRVDPKTQGSNSPMGGTGWLVSNYALDPAGGTPPSIVQPA